MEMLHAGAAVLHVRVAVVTVRYELMQSRPGPCRNQGRNQARESDERNIVTKIKLVVCVAVDFPALT